MDQQRKSNWMDEANFSDEDMDTSSAQYREGAAGNTQETSDRSAGQERDRRAKNMGNEEQAQYDTNGTLASNGKGPGKPGTE